MTALSDVDAFTLRDVAAEGDIREQAWYRELVSGDVEGRSVKHLPDGEMKAARSADRYRAALTRIASRVAFHLPGQHDQRNHGDGDGVGLPDGISNGMPGDVVSIPFDKLPGDVKVAAPSDGDGQATLSIGGRTARLTQQDRQALRKQIINAQYGIDDRAGSDGVFRVTRESGDQRSGPNTEILVSLRPVEGAYITDRGKKVSSPDEAPDDEVYSAQYDLVVNESPDGDFSDEPMTRVSLDELFLSRKSIYDSLERASEARRLDTGNGLVDIFSPRPGAVVLRTEEDQKEPTEILLNARDFRRIDSAIADVMDEGVEDDPTVPRDVRATVATSHGPVEVRFKGRRDEDGDWAGALTLLKPDDDTWGVAVDGPFIDDFRDAFDRNGEVGF